MRCQDTNDRKDEGRVTKTPGFRDCTECWDNFKLNHPFDSAEPDG